MALDARKFDASENYYANSTNRFNWYARENLTMQIYLLMFDGQKYLRLQ